MLAILFVAPYRRLRTRVRSANLAALTITVFTLVVVVAPAVAVAAALAAQASRLYAVLSAHLNAVPHASPAGILEVPLIGPIAEKIASWVPVTAAEIQSWALGQLKSLGVWFGSLVPAAAVGFLNFLVSFAIMLFTLFFLVRDGEGIWKRFVAAIPLSRERTEMLTRRLDAVLRAVLVGTLLTALGQGILGGIGFAVFGLPSPVVFGALMFAFSLLPVGGTAIVWVPASVVLAAKGDWGRAAGLAAWGVVIVGLFDNWFKPLVISERSRMNTLPVFFGVLGGLAAFGLIGLFVGPLVIAIGLALWECAEEAPE